MPIPWLIPAIAAGVSSISNLIGSRKAAQTARINTNLTIAENKKQAELAWQRDKESIEAMNKYNLPSSQMQRFVDAGLNKNLIYHQGSPGNQSQISKYSPPNIQYAYKPKFTGSEFESIKDLPLAVEQIKNLSAVGRINEAKATMEEALSKYASMLARHEAYASMTQMQKDKLEYLIGESKILRMFDNIEEGGEYKYVLKPEYADSLVKSIVDGWKKTSTELGKSQADVKIKDQLLKNLGVVPFLQPLIQFLKLF